MKGEEGMELTDGLKAEVESNRENVRILEDEQPVRSCSTCGVRFASGKLSMTVGKDEAVRQRIPVCGLCEHNPNMSLVKRIPGGAGIAKQYLGGEITDNWRPITDEDKSCITCKTKRTVNALGKCHEAATIVQKKCLFCKYQKNADLVDEASKRAGVGSPMVDNWENFEG